MDQWAQFVSHSLQCRLDPTRFGQFAQILQSKHVQSALAISNSLLLPTKDNADYPDPLITQYTIALLLLDLIDLSSILQALLRCSTSDSAANRESKDGKAVDKTQWRNSYLQEEALFYGLTKHVASGARPRTATQAQNFVRGLIGWMRLLSIHVPGPDVLHDLNVHVSQHDPDAASVKVALAALLIATFDNSKVMGVFREACPRALLSSFSSALTNFVPKLLDHSQVMAERLEVSRSQTLIPLLPVDKKAQAANEEIDKIIDSTMALAADSLPVVDLPRISTRAGLYVFLNSQFVGRPLLDDTLLFAYLHNRYQGDMQSTCIDLILAAFDVLANAIFRNERPQITTLLRSFLINKIPILLTTISTSMFPPLTIEFCITEALNHVDTNAFPTLSSMFETSSNDNMFGDSVRQDFCFACCLHGLILEESIERLLGEPPMQTLPAGGRYTKDGLVQQCLADPDRRESLLEEIELMDGNVEAVSHAVVEIMRQLCQSNETTALKTMCTRLAGKPSCLDILLLFEKPISILQPLCALLDNWRYDEDQGEYQPVYEEFGCILLLVWAFVHRYQLTTIDLGIYSCDSFIARILVRGALSHNLEDTSDQEKGQLDGWIRGLFNADGGGLGDEPMSACPPQDFYLLVPTLFNQVVLACSTGHLNEDCLKSGLEYLVDTFLLPSLVGAFIWLAHNIWESRGDQNAVLQILQILIKPISNDTSPMLNTILNIVASPLEHALRSLQKSEPTRQDIDPLLKALKRHLGFGRTAASDHTELDLWTNPHAHGHTAGQPSGLAANLRHAVSQLTQWSLTTNINNMPTSYTHRLPLACVRILGAPRTLGTLLESIKNLTASGNGAVAIDIVANMICAPDSTMAPSNALNILDSTTQQQMAVPLQGRMTLLEALKEAAEQASQLHKTDVPAAEALVRLKRRVDGQMVGMMGVPGDQHTLLDGLNNTGLDINGSDAVGVTMGTVNGRLNSLDHQGLIGDTTEINNAMAAAAAGQDILDFEGGMGGSSGMLDMGDGNLLDGMDLDF